VSSAYEDCSDELVSGSSDKVAPTDGDPMTADFAVPSAARTFDLAELVDLARDGRIRVPHFQRDFRWESKDVRRLFDSIIKGYPIGSLLLWRRPADAGQIRLGALDLDVPARQDALWVVDGQQRLTSLVNALQPDASHDPRFALSFDLLKNDVSGPRSVDPETSLPLPSLFDLRQLLRWFGEHPEMAENVSAANDVAAKLRKYTIPSYIVDSEEISVLQDIFDRMNSYGKRLSRAETFSALYAPDESRVDDELTIGRVAEECDKKTGFGRIDDDTVLRVILARRGPDVTREIRNEFNEGRRGRVDFPGESREDAFSAGQKALVQAVTFLQEDAGVPHFTFLPYRYLLVVLARYLAHFPSPDPQNRRLLRRWFWRTALVGLETFKGNSTGAMGQLCGRISPGRESQSLQALLEPLVENARALPDLSRFRTTDATTRIVLCVMWANDPRSPETGQPFERAALTSMLKGRPTPADAMLEIRKRTLLDAPQRMWAANRMLLAAEERIDDPIARLLARSPTETEYLDVLNSHFFDKESAEALTSENYSSFLTIRQQAMSRATQSWISQMCEWSFENTPPLDQFDLDEDEDEEKGR
jgi:hypothetical protein